MLKNPVDKITFLPRLQHERDKFENLLNRVGFSRQLTMNGVSGSLSIKDLLADVLSREQFISDRLTEILHDETYSPCTSYTALENYRNNYGYPDYESPLMEQESPDPFVTRKYKNIALDEIVAQELAAYLNIIDTLQKLTHDQCLDHDLFYRTAQYTYRSYRRASMEINRWLKRIAAKS